MISARAIAQAVYEMAEDKEIKDVAHHVLAYLEKNNLMPLLPKVVALLEDIQATASKKATLEIVTAYHMSESLVKDIKDSLGAEHVGKIQEDKNLIGGFVAEYNGVVYDASVMTQLSRLKNVLTS